MNDSLRTILAELRERLEAVYGTRLIQLVLYGSQARGDSVMGSDIDVLVVLKGPVAVSNEVHRTSRILSDISLKHDAVVSCVFMDEDRFTHRNGPLLRNIRREGVAI